MGQHGYEAGTERTASTGLAEIVLDGIQIRSPESVAEHLEGVVFPRLRKQIAEFDRHDHAAVERMIGQEVHTQRIVGPNILKIPHAGFQAFPRLAYVTYGYENYFTAYALFPALMNQAFSLQADLAVLRNSVAARAIVEGGLPPLVRLDHDMADSRGLLVRPKTLDRVWLPHFARAVEPFLSAGVRLLWHCDGNLMDLVPRLIEAGIGGFQGFQYEDGMDYARICRMTDRNGDPLMIWAGVSVTRTLPIGTPDDVVRELKWLVENGPSVGLFLGASSSIVPQTPWDNIRALVEGLEYYRTRGRG